MNSEVDIRCSVKRIRPHDRTENIRFIDWHRRFHKRYFELTEKPASHHFASLSFPLLRAVKDVSGKGAFAHDEILTLIHLTRQMRIGVVRR